MELEQLEAFALSEQRQEVLAHLIPGTQDYYYYHCLHHQHEGALDRAAEFLARWIQQYGESRRTQEIHHRQALLGFERDPESSLRHLRTALGLDFAHVREAEDHAAGRPTALDPALVSRETFLAHAVARSRDLSEISDRALRHLIPGRSGASLSLTLDHAQRGRLLARLTRPDHPDLVALIAADLDDPRSGGFGSRALHRQLLGEQLAALALTRPALLGESAFVNAWLVRLQPSADVDWSNDDGEREAYLTRLWSFVDSLEPAFNALKAHVFYHRLAFDRRRQIYDRARFVAYLALPRRVRYADTAYLERREHRGAIADPGADYSAYTGLDAVRDDEPLVREYLGHFFVDDDDYDAFAAYVRDDYLRVLFAQEKILAGAGDAERWYAMLDDPSQYQALKDRVDIEFAGHCAAQYAVEDPVIIDVDVKNVPTLVIKVFEINPLNHFLTYGREVDTAVDLDGLVAGVEQAHTFTEPPVRRVRRRFTFPELDHPGIYVIELIGGGKSSRALIRKGTLRYVERLGAAGHVLTVLAEDGRVLADASVWLGDREYTAREDGAVVIPYSTNPGRTAILLRHGNLTAREEFFHRAEQYTFSAGIYVDREQLLPGGVATLAVRPILYLNGNAVSVELLNEVSLVLESTDRDGVGSRVEVAPFALHGAAESTHAFHVPDRLSRLSVTVRAKVHSVSEQRDVVLSDSASYAVNQIEDSSATWDVHLSRGAEGYVLHALGRSGEARAALPVNVTIGHRDVSRGETVALQTDAAGRVALGPLTGVAWIQASAAAGEQRWFRLISDAARYPRALHACADEVVELPYLPADDSGVSLLETRSGVFVRDCAEHVDIGDDGMLRLRDLAAGDYNLLLRDSDVEIIVRITHGARQGRWAVSKRRLLERLYRRPLHIAAVEWQRGENDGDDVLAVRVANVSPTARVHVTASRFVAAHSLYDSLGRRQPEEPGSVEASHNGSHYLSGRDIGDEYRYILDRRRADKYPGSNLDRPGLLLNPWAVQDTATDVSAAEEGGEYAAIAPARSRMAPAPKPQASPRGGRMAPSDSLDFLAQPARTWFNLSPDSGGVVRLPRADLASYAVIHVLAVDATSAVHRQVGLAEPALSCRDRRLARPLDPDGHFIEKKHISLLRAGDAMRIEDMETSEVQRFDTLADVFALYATLTSDAGLDEMRWVLDWPGLDARVQRERYSQYACHELDFYLLHKDPAFFAEVIRPHLINKQPRMFMDDYLLDEPLERYLAPWLFGRLNTLERVLLADRVSAAGEPIRQQIRDRLALVPPDVDGDEQKFRAALRGQALAGTGGMGALFRASGASDESATTMRAEDITGLSFGGPGSKAGAISEVLGKTMGGGGPPIDKEIDAYEYDDESTDLTFDDAKKDKAELDDGITDLSVAGADVRDREVVRRFYRQMDRTREWAESHYYRLRLSEQGQALIPVNAFWYDYATRDAGAPFLSSHFIRATSSFAEMMCALAVLDLPATAAEPTVAIDGSRLTLTAASPTVVFHQEIKPVAPTAAPVTILVSQNYFRDDDRYDYSEAERRDKYVHDDFGVHVVYTCQVVLTNPSSASATLDLLLQIPDGAVPVAGGFYTKGQHIRLEAYATRAIEYTFYFPEPGEFRHYPVHVAKAEALIAYAEPQTLRVMREPGAVDTQAWAHISQHASGDVVLRYLAAHNLERLELWRLAWRMRERGFYDDLLGLLAARRCYEHTLWSYAVFHADADRIAEYLHHEDGFLRAAGRALSSPLLSYDASERRWYEHLEYAPLVNARAHRLGRGTTILNQALAEQYAQLLDRLTYRAQLDASDVLEVTYYLLLQDRLSEAFAMFDRLRGLAVTPSIQLDYLTTYVGLRRGELVGARAIASQYEAYPIDRWRRCFARVTQALDEAAGESTVVLDEDSLADTQARLAKSQAGFDFQVDNGVVTLTYQALDACQVNYYRMDIELLFSRQPFVQEQSDRFAIIRPNRTDTVRLSDSQRQHRFSLPAEYESQNIVVEIVAAGVRRAQAHYAHDLHIQVVHQYGQVRVAHRLSNQPMSTAYVKVYARLQNGAVVFYKDGYTDVCGVFDYASLSTDQLDHVARFALLVFTEKHGAVVREAPPPLR